MTGSIKDSLELLKENIKTTTENSEHSTYVRSFLSLQCTEEIDKGVLDFTETPNAYLKYSKNKTKTKILVDLYGPVLHELVFMRNYALRAVQDPNDKLILRMDKMINDLNQLYHHDEEP